MRPTLIHGVRGVMMDLLEREIIAMILFFIGVIVVGLLAGLFMPQLFTMFGKYLLVYYFQS
jgi:hypothetical protein